MLKLSGSLPAHQVTNPLLGPGGHWCQPGCVSLPVGGPLSAGGAQCAPGITASLHRPAHSKAGAHQVSETCHSGPHTHRPGGSGCVHRATRPCLWVGPATATTAHNRGQPFQGGVTGCTCNTDAQTAQGSGPLASQLRSGLFLFLDPRTLHITKHIGGSSALHHSMGQDIHLSRCCWSRSTAGAIASITLMPHLSSLSLARGPGRGPTGGPGSWWLLAPPRRGPSSIINVPPIWPEKNGQAGLAGASQISHQGTLSGVWPEPCPDSPGAARPAGFSGHFEGGDPPQLYTNRNFGRKKMARRQIPAAVT